MALILRTTPPLHLISVLLVSISLHSFPIFAQSTPPKREFRAAWIATVVNLDWPSRPGLPSDEQKQELVELLDDLSAAGINAVVFQVRTESDALYDSPYEPWSYWLTGAQGQPPSPYYDPLAFAVEEAHNRGMELHAWFNPYRAIRPSNYFRHGTHVSKAHPEWILSFSDISILDPGLPEVQQHVTNVVMDIVNRYDVDGIHADDYFYPYPPNQISNQDDATYLAHNPTGLSRSDWRRNNINTLLKGIYDSIQVVKPWVKFGMSPFGIYRSGTPSGIVGLSSVDVIYCDAIAWLQGQYIDYLTPQLYWQIGGNQDYLKLMPWWSAQLNGRHLYPGQAAYRINSSNWSSSELPNQIRANRSHRSDNVLGSVFFRARSGIWDNPKGFRDSLRTDLYRYRALIPGMSWKDQVPPLASGNLRYTSPGGAPAKLLWDVPATATDGDTASRYVVYRYDSDPGPTPNIDDPGRILFVTGSPRYDAPVPSLDSGSYFYGVTSLDRNHNEGPISNIIEVASPKVPFAALPIDSADSLPDSIDLVWRSQSSTSRYTVEVWAAGQPGDPMITRTTADTSTTVSGFEGQTMYGWRVRSGNAGGSSAFSSPSHFRTGFPATPALAYPANFTANSPVSFGFQWSSAAGADAYRIQVSRSSAFIPLELDTTTAADTAFAVADLASYTIYFWRVRGTNSIGQSKWSEVWKFRTQTVVRVAERPSTPTEFRLYQNYPNPFNPSTIIRFDLPIEVSVSLHIYDILGREVRSLVDGITYGPGSHSAIWHGRDDHATVVANGVYVYRLTAGQFIQTRRMILLR